MHHVPRIVFSGKYLIKSYRGYGYDTETELYYLQSRYYDPKVGRFINADAFSSQGQDILGNNLYTYCGNNPVNYSDTSGNKARPVGAGVQVEVSKGNASVGIEVILYWDVDECIDGAPVIAVYVYGGVSVDVNDSFIASIVGIITDNADLLLDATGAGVMTVAALISDNFSVSVSGVFIIGNDEFVSTKSYEESFTSIGGTLGKGRASVAYSETCLTVSAGYNVIGGNSILPSRNVSKTYYQQLFIIQFGTSPSRAAHGRKASTREVAYA